MEAGISLLEVVMSCSWTGWNIGFIGGELGILGEWGPVSKRSSKVSSGSPGEQGGTGKKVLSVDLGEQIGIFKSDKGLWGKGGKMDPDQEKVDLPVIPVFQNFPKIPC